jgi:filamentous hemagglutinin family protein
MALMAGSSACALPVFSGNAQASGGAGGLPVIRTLGPDLVTVDLNARRTIIDWTSFNLAPGETVSYASFLNQNIVLNRVANGPININGLISSALSDSFPLTQPVTAGGNVWFYSPQGVIFGPNARFAGGALLATSAAVNTTQFLNENVFGMDFTGTGNGGSVTVAAGASFTARGHLALVAPVVTTAAGSVFNAGDYGTVLYGGVDSYRINFISIANDDLSFFDFIVPAGVAGGSAAPTPLSIAGQTTGANVYLSAISRSGLGGLLINAPGLLVGASSFNNYGQVTITTGRNITLGQVNETSTPVVGAQTGDIRVGTITASGNVNLVSTGTSGAGNITADRLQIGQGSLITANNLTVGPQGIRTGDSNVAAGGLNLNVSGLVNVPLIVNRINFNVFSNQLQFNGSINEASRLADLRFGSVTTGGVISISANTLNATSLTAPSVRASTAGDFNVGVANGSTEVLMASSTNMTLGSVTAGGLTRLTFEDLNLTGTVTADSATLRILTPGQATVGGSGQARGISNAELQRFRVTTSMSIFGGIDGQFPVSTDLVIQDFDVDPTRIPELKLFAKSTHNVIVRGRLAPTTSGGVLTIGDPPNIDSIWKPNRILVSGSIGTASGDAVLGFTDVRAFRDVSLYANTDIILGSQRFADLVAATPVDQIDVAAGLPLGVAPVDSEIGRIFLVAGGARMRAGERIVQQNTGALGQERGFYLTGDGVPPTAPILSVGGAQVVDVFGTLKIGDQLVSGQQAVSSGRIARLEGDLSTGEIRINGCLLGLGCAVFTPAQQFRLEQFRPTTAAVSIDPPVLSPPPPVDEDDREAETVTTGAGNEEIWRRPR